jgi:hypothetical protein
LPPRVGPPEVLVNTIGTYRFREALTATPEDLRLMIDVNVGAAKPCRTADTCALGLGQRPSLNVIRSQDRGIACRLCMLQQA